MKLRSAVARTLVLAALMPAPALAQSIPTTAPAGQTPTAGVDAWNQIRVDLELNNGTPLPDYIAHLSDLTHGNFILLSDPAIDPSSIRLPQLRLREMPLGSAVQLLQELPGSDIKVEADDNPATKVPTWRIVVRPFESGTGFAPAAPGGPNEGPATEPSAKPQTKLYPLGRILFGADAPRPPAATQPAAKDDSARIDQLLQLIDLTLAASADDDPRAPRAQINYHAPTRTLIVRATADQLAAIEQAIHALAPDPGDPKESFARAQRERDEAAGRVQYMEAQLAQSRVQLADDKDQLNDLKRRVDRMAQAEAELAQARGELADQKRHADEAVLRGDRMAQALREAHVPDPTTQP